MKTWQWVLIVSVCVPVFCCGGCFVVFVNSYGKVKRGRDAELAKLTPEERASREWRDAHSGKAAMLLPIAKRVVLSTLKYPDTAEWKSPDGGSFVKFVFYKTDAGIELAGKVQAKNAFGVPSTYDWAVEFTNSSTAFVDEEILSVSIDGKRQIVGEDE